MSDKKSTPEKQIQTRESLTGSGHLVYDVKPGISNDIANMINSHGKPQNEKEK
ncbi:hypothetical protein [Rothia aerolata]|uniref:Uncharacterized protein n=1 Tax=Rothia aerolata TaxID=1812262 RepID=A0A917IR33_9MICC|nr:hypothetical protein [Rothia aerolata]GGH61897.1 hypothetical protein GCM10007359_11550 [Rothia aerolata]